MLIDGIEGWKDDVEDAHLADGSVTDAGGDVDALARADRNSLAVQFHLGIGGAFKDVIDLGMAGVIMRFGIEFDVDGMQAERSTGQVSKGPASPTTRAADRIDLREVRDCIRRRFRHSGTIRRSCFAHYFFSLGGSVPLLG